MVRAVSRWVLLCGLTGAGVASACAVCGQPSEAQNFAYLMMTLMLSIVPLLAMGAVVYALYRRHVDAEQQRSGAVPTPSPLPSSASGPVAARPEHP